MKVEIWTQDNVLTHQKVVDTSVYEQDVVCQTAIYTGYWFLHNEANQMAFLQSFFTLEELPIKETNALLNATE
jgi:hypothetical protein